jgi:hypothetical protein
MSSEDPFEPLWDEADLARYLKSSPFTERKRRMNGDGCPYIKIGSSVRYIPAVARQFALERIRHSTSEALPTIAEQAGAEQAAKPAKPAPTVKLGSRPRGRPRKADHETTAADNSSTVSRRWRIFSGYSSSRR